MSGVAHPPEVKVELTGDLAGRAITLKPWVMGQRARLRPMVAALLTEVAGLQSNTNGITLVDLFLIAEEQIAGVVQASIGDQLTSDEWDSMAWEDLPALAQAVWDLNIQRPDGGGLVGKLTAAMGPMLARTVAAQHEASAKDSGSSQTSTSKTPTPLRPAASPSSPADGAPIQSA